MQEVRIQPSACPHQTQILEVQIPAEIVPGILGVFAFAFAVLRQ
jgi:hypothetical protein